MEIEVDMGVEVVLHVEAPGMQDAKARRTTAACISGAIASFAATITFTGRNSPFLTPRSMMRWLFRAYPKLFVLRQSAVR